MKLSAWHNQDLSRQSKLGNWPQSFVNSGWSPHSSPTVNWIKILQVWFSSVAIVRANLINLLHVYTCKSLIKRYGKTGDKNVQLILQHCSKTSWKRMLSVSTAHAQTCFAAYQVFAVCKMLLQKVESSSTFCNKICTCCAFYRPKSNLFCSASDGTPVNGVTPA